MAQARTRPAASCSKPWAPQPISACWCPGPRASARPRWCGPCAPTAGSSNSTAPRWARCAPKTGSRASSSAVATVRDGGGVLLITDIDALLPSTAEPVATLILAELRSAVATARRRVRRHLRSARRRRPAAAGTRPVRPRARAEPARRQPPASSCSRCCCATCRPRSSISTKSPSAHRVSSSPIWPRWCARPRCGRRRGPARTASRRR